MKEKVILAFVLVSLSMFGLRGFLPTISSSALIGIFTIAGFIGCYYHQRYSRNKRRIGGLAMSNGWLTAAETKQILYCQKDSGNKFGEIAIRRNYLTPRQVDSILEIQTSTS